MKQPQTLDLFQDVPAPQPGLASGYPELDEKLPGGGWPRGVVTEIFYPREQWAKAFKLVLPALARLSHSQQWLAWVAPPKVIGALSLKSQGVNTSRILQIHPHPTGDGLWAIEKALRSPTCSAVLSWVASADQTALERLQKAAQAGQTRAFLFRPDWAFEPHSPVELRLKLAKGAKHNEMVVHRV